MRVRRGTTDDLAAIAAIYNHAIEHTVATFDTVAVTVAERRVWFLYEASRRGDASGH